MTSLIRSAVLAGVLATLSGCSDSQSKTTDSKQSDTFTDSLISFPIPEGGTVKLAADNSYLVFFGEEFFYVMLRGEAELEDFGRQRTEASRTVTLSQEGKPIEDGESVVTVGDVSEVSRHLVDDDPVYLYTHSGTAQSGKESAIGYNTIGFGSVHGVAIWFQHTSEDEDDHPGSILGFLETVTFK